MEKNQINQTLDNSIAQLSLPELRQKWAECWSIRPHARIGRALLERSLEFKLRENAGHGLTDTQQARLDRLIWLYKRNPRCFEQSDIDIKPGTQLVKIWNDEQHIVTVLPLGFSYNGRTYGSLTATAYAITGTAWNGWVFFNLKKGRREK